MQRRFKNAQGEKEADFLPVVAWRQNADFCNQYLSKGSKVAIEGSIQTRQYDAKDGSKRTVTEIIADHVESLGGGNNGAQVGNARRTQQSQPQSNPLEEQGFVEVDPTEDLPF